MAGPHEHAWGCPLCVTWRVIRGSRPPGRIARESAQRGSLPKCRMQVGHHRRNLAYQALRTSPIPKRLPRPPRYGATALRPYGTAALRRYGARAPQFPSRKGMRAAPAHGHSHRFLSTGLVSHVIDICARLPARTTWVPGALSGSMCHRHP